MSILKYFVNKSGGGWFGYRGLYAVLLSSPMWGLMIYWVTYTGIHLSAERCFTQPFFLSC